MSEPERSTGENVKTLTKRIVRLRTIEACYTCLEENPDVKPNEVTMNSITNKARTVAEAKDVLQWFNENHPDVKPDKVTMNIFYNRLIKSRQDGKVDIESLNYAESLVKEVPGLAEKIEGDLKTLIVRAICHFASDQTQKGQEYLRKVFLAENVSPRDIERTAIVCFAFLPQQNSLNELARLVLPQHGLGHILHSAEEYAHTFWDIQARWAEEQEEALKVKFGGGENVFTRPYFPAPIDRNAATVAS